MRRHDIRHVAIDALGDLAYAAEGAQRFRDYLYALCQELIVRGVTALFTLEDHPGAPGWRRQEPRFASMVDALIELDVRTEPEAHRTIRVAKGRGIAHDLRPHHMRIAAGGIVVGDAL